MVDVVWLPRDAQRTVPWRNGLGSTREVAIEPVSGSVERGFDWRISRAGVANDGPFSSFPGIDRSLWLVRGAGLELSIEGNRERLDQPWQRVDFVGEAAVSARLLGGPVEDLNVMVRRGTTRATAEIHELCDGAEMPIVCEAGSQVVLCLHGAVALLGGVLGAGDAVRCDGAGSCTLLALDGRPVVLVASFGAA